MDPIRNMLNSNIETDVPRKDGKGNFIIWANQNADLTAVDEKLIAASLNNGKLKSLADAGYVKVGSPILGDAKKAKKISAKEAKTPVDSKKKVESNDQTNPPSGATAGDEAVDEKAQDTVAGDKKDQNVIK